MTAACCSSAGSKRPCPACGRECLEVPVRTIAHHINRPWQWQPGGQRFFFCASQGCAIAYFGEDGSRILQAQLRPQVGSKQASGDALLCYCYGVTVDDARNDPAVRDFVIAETRAGRCACETRNPSGRCCLKDFPAPDAGRG